MTKKINHRMIELARKSRKLNQTELSQLLSNLNQSNLSKVERGEIPVSNEVLLNISKVLDYPQEFFYLQEPKSTVANIYFRKRASISVRDFDKIFSDVKILLGSIDFALEEIELKEYEKHAFDLTSDWTPESAAIRMREVMQIPNGQPVKDIISKIEDMGIIVFLYDSPHDKFDGLTSYTDRGVPVIFVNKNKPNDRLKSTIVHELFHLVLHIPCHIEPWRDVETEVYAATAEFLMPAQDCAYDLANLTYEKLGQLKSYWGVSKQLIIRRAKDLDQITEQKYKYLSIEISRRGERRDEKGYVEIDEPKILRTVLKLLKEELNYTYEDLAKKLCLSYSDFCFHFTPEMENKIKLRIVSKSVG